MQRSQSSAGMFSKKLMTQRRATAISILWGFRELKIETNSLMKWRRSIDETCKTLLSSNETLKVRVNDLETESKMHSKKIVLLETKSKAQVYKLKLIEQNFEIAQMQINQAKDVIMKNKAKIRKLLSSRLNINALFQVMVVCLSVALQRAFPFKWTKKIVVLLVNMLFSPLTYFRRSSRRVLKRALLTIYDALVTLKLFTFLQRILGLSRLPNQHLMESLMDGLMTTFGMNKHIHASTPDKGSDPCQMEPPIVVGAPAPGKNS